MLDQVEPILDKAKKHEKKYEWLKAKISYEKAIKFALERKKYSQVADIYELIGYCFFRSALQAERNEQFEQRMNLSTEAYKEMLDLLKKYGGNEAEISHANSMITLTQSWVEHELSKMEALVEKWWTHENKALFLYKKMQIHTKVGEISNNLLEYSVDRRIFFNRKEFQKRRKELIDIGEKAILELSKTDDRYELARAYCWTAWCYGIGSGVTKIETKGDKFYNKWLDYSRKAAVFSKEIGDGWLIGWAYNAKSNTSIYKQNFASLLKDGEKVIEQGKIIKDNYMMLTGKWHIGHILGFEASIGENPEKIRDTLTRAVELTKEAIIQAEIINAPICKLLTQFCYSVNLVSLALLKTEIKEKEKLIKEAVKIGREGMNLVQGRDWVQKVFPMVALSNALLLLSKIEPNRNLKRGYLEEALKIRQEARAAVSSVERPQISNVPSPNFVWGVYQIATAKSEIAKIETNVDQKKTLFKDAVSTWEECLELSEKMLEAFPDKSEWLGGLGFYYYDFGGILTQIYNLDRNKSGILKAIEVYKKGLELFNKYNLLVHVSESYWKIALIYNLLGEHLEASDNYVLASKAYQSTIQRIPQLKDFCENYSAYMLAWSKIEKALHHHARQEYAESKKYYEKAATLHERSGPMSYMASNYWAWATMENAEGLSRKEMPKKAIQVFIDAQVKFRASEDALKKKFTEIESQEEKLFSEELINISRIRRKYCQIRVDIEEAKILDKNGDYASSSKRYGLAKSKLRQLLKETETEQNKRDFSLMLNFCEAWEKMELAEEKTDPELYIQAAQQFEEAKELSPTKKIGLLALGNSSFCKALAYGIKYEMTRDVNQHLEAKKQINIAENFYL
ncbi:MAG: hypothetical protein P8Y18_03890, partial [Candidatus Bathyarchaeota archaeon]